MKLPKIFKTKEFRFRDKEHYSTNQGVALTRIVYDRYCFDKWGSIVSSYKFHKFTFDRIKFWKATHKTHFTWLPKVVYFSPIKKRYIEINWLGYWFSL